MENVNTKQPETGPLFKESSLPEITVNVKAWLWSAGETPSYEVAVLAYRGSRIEVVHQSPQGLWQPPVNRQDAINWPYFVQYVQFNATKGDKVVVLCGNKRCVVDLSSFYYHVAGGLPIHTFLNGVEYLPEDSEQSL